MSSAAHDPRPLAAIATRDLIVLTHIVKLGISALRWRVPGVDDLDLLRAVLRRREGLVTS